MNGWRDVEWGESDGAWERETEAGSKNNYLGAGGAQLTMPASLDWRGDGDSSMMRKLGRLLRAGYDEDFGGKTKSAFNRVRTKGCDDVAFQVRELLP